MWGAGGVQEEDAEHTGAERDLQVVAVVFGFGRFGEQNLAQNLASIYTFA